MTCKNCNKDKKLAARGLCHACYMRERRNARPGRRRNGEALADLLSYRDQSWRAKIYDWIYPHPTETGCIEFLGPKTRGGYGFVAIAGVNVLAHRAIHAFNGGDPTTPVVVQTCGNPVCCNPEHLVGVDHAAAMATPRGRGDGRLPGDHLRDRKNHPRARRIVTPVGEFPSAALAAEAVGLHYKTVLGLASSQKKGFAWVDVEEAA